MMRRVCLVGAGFISQVHAEAIRATPRVLLQGVIDPNLEAAQGLARRWAIPRVFASTAQALDCGEIDCVHVLTPPNLHAETALPFLKAGKPVLLEKPLATNRGECDLLIAAARETEATLGVSQNFVFHPAFDRLRRAISNNRLGQPRSITCIYNVGVRQIAARQFSHWMFSAPENILLEQAVHPLSQIIALAGPINRCMPMAGPPLEISPGVPVYTSLSLMLEGTRLPAELRMALDVSFPFWQVSVICDDGVGVADILSNRFFTYKRGPSLEPIDAFLSGARTGLSILGESVRNAANFSLSTVKLRSRNDGFFESVKRTIGAFHRALDDGRLPELDGTFGAHLVSLCEDIAEKAFTAPLRAQNAQRDGQFDIAVLGGTGFIGTHVVKRLLDAGQRVGVMARNIRNLPEVFCDERVTVLRGDVRRLGDVERIVGRASIVINLAHGGGGKTRDEVCKSMLGAAETVARACLSANVRRLVHIGSIASLYLGSNSCVTGSTPPDEKSTLRSDYAHAKGECDQLLLSLHKSEGLPVCIVRPGLVVGQGGLAFHSGLGFFNNEQHCIGWNSGRNPLPFVLVEDVADAIWRACVAPDAVGRTYNIVGDVRLSAREYLGELSKTLSRPLCFHPRRPTMLWLEESAKWLVKLAIGRKDARPTRRDILSRGLKAEFDCGDAKRDLGWQPITSREMFIERGIRAFAKQ